MLTPSEAARRVEASELTAEIAVESGISFVQWGPIIAGALVAVALSLVLMAFGSAIGLAVLSSSPTWRDASPALTVASGIYLLLTALVSFGLGAYVVGRLREHWHPTAHRNVVEFRDGAHGVLSWAIAAVVSGLVIAASVAGVASKAIAPAASPTAASGEPLIAYELDRLFRADRHPPQADLNYSRAEAGRSLLAATGRQGISAHRAYLVRLVAADTGAAPPDAERRVDAAITAATTAVHKARRSTVILGLLHCRLAIGRSRCGLVRCVRRRSPSGRGRPTLSWRR